MDVIVNDRNRSGDQFFGPIEVPVGARRVTLTIHRDELTDLDQSFTWALELSVDTGRAWVSLGGGGLDLSKCGHDDPRFIEPNKQAAVSGSSRGLLVTEDRQGCRFWWVSEVQKGHAVIEPFTSSNPNRMVRGVVTLTASSLVRAEVEFI